VLPLLPPLGSALLVTSRRRFSVPGLLVRDVDTLPRDDAVALLVGLAPRVKGLAGEIASLCGHLPLALRLAGGLLADRDDLEVNQYIERLRRARLSERSGLTEVAATLQLSEAMLPIPLRTRWHELSLLVGGFEMSWAGAVWQADVDTADYWLGQLRRNSLIEWSESEQWYRLHDLVREYAAVHLDAEQRQLAARRHAAYFRNMMEDADRLYKEGGVGFGEAARVFDRAWANTERALSWAQEHTDNIDLQADSLSSIDLANRIFESLWHLGRYTLRANCCSRRLPFKTRR
jgi:hypothetical protein